VNSAQYVSDLIAKLKTQGNALTDVAWQAALACVGWAYVYGARGQYCTPANRRARYSDDHPTIKTACQNFNGSDSVGCEGCKWYPNDKYTRIFDCRGFTYWILKQVYGWELQGGGCTSQWNDEKNWKAKGEVSDGIPQNTLVCLFYYKKDSKGNRTKTLQHTGFYLNGETIECSSGVQHFKTINKKWEVWGIPACVESEVVQMPNKPNEPIEQNKPKEPEKEDNLPTLRKGSKGKYVTLLQTKLANLGYNLGKSGVDGDFGSATLAAVKAFQKDRGLVVDGVVGKKTWEALMNTAEPQKLYTVTIKGLTKTVADEIVSKYGGTMTAE